MLSEVVLRIIRLTAFWGLMPQCLQFPHLEDGHAQHTCAIPILPCPVEGDHQLLQTSNCSYGEWQGYSFTVVQHTGTLLTERKLGLSSRTLWSLWQAKRFVQWHWYLHYHQGETIPGVPVGSQSHMDDFVHDKVDMWTTFLKTLSQIALNKGNKNNSEASADI